MKLVLDMNLSPALVPPLHQAGYEAVHWSSLGDPRALDSTILTWALLNGHVVLTHDLDFGAILAATGESAPSVLQVRTQDVSPAHLLPLLLGALTQFRSQLESGALVTIDERRSRARILPIERPPTGSVA